MLKFWLIVNLPVVVFFVFFGLHLIILQATLIPPDGTSFFSFS